MRNRLTSKRLRRWLWVGLMLFSMSASAGSGPIVALFDMEDRGSKLEKDVLANLIDYLAAKLTEGGYQVVPPDQVRERLKQTKTESHKTCYDQSCQVEVGQELAAQKTLSTKILRIGDTCQVTAVLYDLKRATTESAATEERSCEINQLLDGVKKISDKMCLPLKDAQQKANSGLQEFEALAKNVEHEKAEKDRMEKAWKIVSVIAKDERVAKDKRIEALKKFFDEFKKENPYMKEAQALWSEIQTSPLIVRTLPEGADVTIDGKPAGKSPANRELKAGRYEVVASLAGYQQKKGFVLVEQGKPAELTLTLESVAAVTPPSTPKEEPKTEVAKTDTPKLGDGVKEEALVETKSEAPGKPMSKQRLWAHITLWSGVGLVAFGGTSLALGLVESGKYADTGEPNAKSMTKTFTGMMFIGFGLGAALVTTGLVLWLTEKPENANTGTTVTAAPTLDGQGMVFGLSGRW